jgi:hypothetical protein
MIKNTIRSITQKIAKETNAMKEGKIFDQAITDIASLYLRKGTIALSIGTGYG